MRARPRRGRGIPLAYWVGAALFVAAAQVAAAVMGASQ